MCILYVRGLLINCKLCATLFDTGKVWYNNNVIINLYDCHSSLVYKMDFSLLQTRISYKLASKTVSFVFYKLIYI